MPRPSASRPHVLFIIDQLDQLGGAERVLFRMVRNLPAAGFSCSVVTFQASDRVIDSLPCPSYVLSMGSTMGAQALKMALRLRRIIRTEKTAIVHTFFESSDLWGGLVARISGCRILVSSRRDMGILRQRKHRIAYRVLGPMFSQVQTVSEAVRKFIIHEDRLPPAKVVVVHNGIDLDHFPATDGRPLMAPPQIVSVGHIRKVKGFDTLIRAAALVCREFPACQFVIAGETREPEHRDELVSLAVDLGVADNVKLLGPANDVPALLRGASAFCMLSRSEGFSNAVLEAMACGLPAVVTDVGGNREAVEHGVTGLLVPPDNPKAAAESLLALLRDQQRLHDMGKAARVRVEEKFAVQAMVGRLVMLYEDLLGRSRA